MSITNPTPQCVDSALRPEAAGPHFREGRVSLPQGSCPWNSRPFKKTAPLFSRVFPLRGIELIKICQRNHAHSALTAKPSDLKPSALSPRTPSVALRKRVPTQPAFCVPQRVCLEVDSLFSCSILKSAQTALAPMTKPAGARAGLSVREKADPAVEGCDVHCKSGASERQVQQHGLGKKAGAEEGSEGVSTAVTEATVPFTVSFLRHSHRDQSVMAALHQLSCDQSSD